MSERRRRRIQVWGDVEDGSAVVMLVAVAKIFLVDTERLQGLYRVFSVCGLGFTLMVLAYLTGLVCLT